MYTVALLDFDGTIANTDSLHLACWNRVLNTYDIRLTEHFYTNYCVGVLSPKVARLIKKSYPSITQTTEEMAMEKDQIYDTYIQANRVPLMPGVREILELLRRNHFKLGVVSGTPESSIMKTLQDYGIDSFFEVISSRETIEKGKPAPDGYLYALERLHVKGPSAISFEDTKSGVLAAKAADMISFAVLQPLTRQHDFSAADFICADMYEAIKVLSS